MKSNLPLAVLAAILALAPAPPAAAQSSTFSIVPVLKALGSPYSASSISPADVWMVGTLSQCNSSTGVCPAIAEHWDGATWKGIRLQKRPAQT